MGRGGGHIKGRKQTKKSMEDGGEESVSGAGGGGGYEYSGRGASV